MTKTVFVLAFSLLAQQASAEDYYLSAQSKGSGHCAWYKGSFDSSDYQGPKEDGSRPRAICKVNDDGDAQCVVTGHGIKAFPAKMSFEGSAEIVGRKVLIIRGMDDVIGMKLLCSKEYGCSQFQMWNDESKVGFACDMAKWTPEAPKKPVPPPPPLLRKPDKSNEPVEPKGYTL
jgi:hypothetical protein